ncbi:MAG: hypothetical protein LH619_12815 [Chitinophagaceae bacterium]|nr:hypothetical protein [Chitinophagaceae bacterium]
MASSQESYEHGEHNEAACNLLALNQNFPDWTITTAFYASLHFVTAKIFPFSHPIKEQEPLNFKNIEEWQKFKNYGSAKRHELLKDLVAKYCDSVADQYEWLLSSSWNARYHHHQHPKELVNKAISYMKQIKAHCTPTQEKKGAKK